MEYLCHCLTPWLAFRGCATAKSRRLQVENRGSYGSLVTALLLHLRSAIDPELENQISSEVRHSVHNHATRRKIPLRNSADGNCAHKSKDQKKLADETVSRSGALPSGFSCPGETMILWGLDLALNILGRTRVLITIVLLGWLFRAQVVKLRPSVF